MISNSKIRSVRIPFEPTEVFTSNPYMEKVFIKNIYQRWGGETIGTIKQKHIDNPYTLRIGLPHLDEKLKQDNIFFIQSYLSYNPITKDIEKREIIPYRNVEKVYIGQSAGEEQFQDYKLIVAGNIIANDYSLIEDGKSLKAIIRELSEKIQKLEQEVLNLKSYTEKQTIYK
jgi:hypothetical protein